MSSSTTDREQGLDALGGAEHWARRREHWIQTFTGRKFYPLAPRPDDVCLEDIAHALSLICRWGGHARHHFSVGQHSINVSLMVEHLGGDKRDCTYGLLHDGQESYVGDMVLPLKASAEMDVFRRAEELVERAVFEHFGVKPEHDFNNLVKSVDRRMGVTEGRILLPNSEKTWKEQVAPFLEPWPEGIVIREPRQPADVEAAFIRRYQELAA